MNADKPEEPDLLAGIKKFGDSLHGMVNSQASPASEARRGSLFLKNGFHVSETIFIYTGIGISLLGILPLLWPSV